MTILLSNHTNIDQKSLQIRHQQMKVCDGAFLTLTRSYSREPIVMENRFHLCDRHTALHFILNGQTRFTQTHSVPPAVFSGDKCNLMLIQPNHTIQTLYAKGDFLMASFYIQLDQFINLMNIAVEALPDKFQRAIIKNVCSCNNFKWTPKAYYIVNQLLGINPEVSTNRPFLESKMLELVVNLLETEQCDYYSNISITSSDKDKIHFIHEVIMSDLSSCYTLEQLARMAATNEFILKKGFREVFGKPVYQYLMQKRMEKAMELLMTTQLQVCEIATLVGYDDASAFTRVFKKIFNLLPTRVRDNPIRV